MTSRQTILQLRFQMLCGKYLIDPGVALENDNLTAALLKHDFTAVEQILQEEF